MSTKSAENYLDELLNSVNSGQSQETFKEEVLFEEAIVEEEGLVEETILMDEDTLLDEGLEDKLYVQSEEPTITRNTAKAEAEFLMEFEQELAGDDFDDFLREFEENDIQPEDRLESIDMELNEEDALLSMLGGGFAEEVEPIEPIFEEESGREELSLEELALSGIEVEEAFAEIPATDSNEPIDLSQMGEEDLISLLAGAEDLSDIGQLFAQNDNNLPIEGEDPFAAFAENEMTEAEEDANIIKSNAKPEKKKGFLEKLSALLFGKEEKVQEKAEPVSITPEEMPGVIELSDENADILSLFAEADSGQIEEKETVSKGKGKKKEKKKKEPKQKAPKKPKAPKPKKEKKPKEKDNTPPLPKGPVALVCVLAISIFILVFFGTDLISYSSAVSKAKDLYELGQYSQAAEVIAGVTIKEEDMMIQGKISTLATVHSQLSEYDVFMKNDRKAEALDSLISAAGRVVVNEDNTLTFDCADEMEMMKNRITRELEDGFSMSYEKALELYALTERDRAEYTRELQKIYVELGLIEE